MAMCFALRFRFPTWFKRLQSVTEEKEIANNIEEEEARTKVREVFEMKRPLLFIT